MDREEEEDAETLRRSERLREKDGKQYRTPNKSEIRKKIDEEYWNGNRSGKSIDQLKLQRRGPNDLIMGENRYRTEMFDPLDDSDGASIKSFVTSGDGDLETESSQNCDDHQNEEENENDDDGIVVLSDNEAAVEFSSKDCSQNANQDNDQDVDIASTKRKRRRSAAVISSGDESEDDDEAPILLSKRKRPNRSSTVLLSQSTVASNNFNENEDSEGSLTKLGDFSPASPVASSLSNDDVDEIRLNILNAPRKRRRSEREERDDSETPVRRSERAVEIGRSREKLRKKLFHPYVEHRRDFLEKLARKSLVEQPEEVDEEAVVITKPEMAWHPSNESDQFWPIGELSAFPDGAVVGAIRGKVVLYGNDDTRPVRSGRDERTEIRQIVLQDDTGSVRVTLWRNYCNNENIRQDAWVVISNLKKTTYQRQPSLCTTFFNTTVITKYTPPVDSSDNWIQTESSQFRYKVEQVYYEGTTIYNACARCCFTKTSPTDNSNQRHFCIKCKRNYDVADTEVGIAMRIFVSDGGDPELKTIFTRSARKLCPNIPINWGRHEGSIDVVGDRFKKSIIDMVTACLPSYITGTEQIAGDLDILGVSKD